MADGIGSSPKVSSFQFRPTEITEEVAERALKQGATEYIVKPGDSLWRLAQQNGVSVESIDKLNQLIDVNSLRAGQKLYIPTRESNEGWSAKAAATYINRRRVGVQDNAPVPQQTSKTSIPKEIDAAEVRELARTVYQRDEMLSELKTQVYGLKHPTPFEEGPLRPEERRELHNHLGRLSESVEKLAALPNDDAARGKVFAEIDKTYGELQKFGYTHAQIITLCGPQAVQEELDGMTRSISRMEEKQAEDFKKLKTVAPEQALGFLLERGTLACVDEKTAVDERSGAEKPGLTQQLVSELAALRNDKRLNPALVNEAVANWARQLVDAKPETEGEKERLKNVINALATFAKVEPPKPVEGISPNNNHFEHIDRLNNIVRQGGNEAAAAKTEIANVELAASSKNPAVDLKLDPETAKFMSDFVERLNPEERAIAYAKAKELCDANLGMDAGGSEYAKTGNARFQANLLLELSNTVALAGGKISVALLSQMSLLYDRGGYEAFVRNREMFEAFRSNLALVSKQISEPWTQGIHHARGTVGVVSDLAGELPQDVSHKMRVTMLRNGLSIAVSARALTDSILKKAVQETIKHTRQRGELPDGIEEVKPKIAYF